MEGKDPRKEIKLEVVCKEKSKKEASRERIHLIVVEGGEERRRGGKGCALYRSSERVHRRDYTIFKDRLPSY